MMERQGSGLGGRGRNRVAGRGEEACRLGMCLGAKKDEWNRVEGEIRWVERCRVEWMRWDSIVWLGGVGLSNAMDGRAIGRVA